ncbi:hypothetical protein PXH59_12755 [Xenorhabdus sp. SF857]|uniref:hypothetical protein n=1 Tax=Xenorhabdus bakwenae TaxID=3026967 RepID=UPI002557F023|nr:hypothetical protein [Xenorhabdus sp. SF857]WFQ78575.1 hypothetical protein PXH59_12755 [Xenorhabdus sp. SF857]
MMIKSQKKFVELLFKSEDYRIIRELCNHTKHFRKKSAPDTTIVKGARAGLSRAGDNLGHVYLLVGNQDIRVHLSAVYKIYSDYFNHK